jgi:hypothetical protein
MTANRIHIDSLLLGGYRSFGVPQRFQRFSALNLLIGPNNSGKSNVLRFVHDIYPKLAGHSQIDLTADDRHIPKQARFVFGKSISISKDDAGNYTDFIRVVRPKFAAQPQAPSYDGQFLRIFQKKAATDGTSDVWFTLGQDRKLITDGWDEAFAILQDQELMRAWQALTSRHGGSRKDWVPESLQKLLPHFHSPSIAMIPAIRRIGEKGSESDGFSGEGIIERLARIQNPGAQRQAEKEKFARINSFLQSVTDNQSAVIEIPYERDTILVHMDGRVLPLESLGTGIHEVVILAAASTILENTVICMEEPELHLNPILQRKLIRHLIGATNNQYFITTHSAALMDTPGAEIYHVQLNGGQSEVARVTSSRHRSSVCEDLGYHPSDLLLANCIIWVEGPTDRTYLLFWLNAKAPRFQEGIHFSIMFYGGRLAAHIAGNDIDECVNGLISLRRLNRRAVILIDSDKAKKSAPLNHTKNRLVDEFNSGPGHAWVTDGREIENYIAPEVLRDAIAKVCPSAKVASRFRRFDNSLAIKLSSGKKSVAPKIKVAKFVVENFPADLGRLDLEMRLDELIQFIEKSNPSLERVAR